jgi:hypothetical protein
VADRPIVRVPIDRGFGAHLVPVPVRATCPVDGRNRTTVRISGPDREFGSDSVERPGRATTSTSLGLRIRIAGVPISTDEFDSGTADDGGGSGSEEDPIEEEKRLITSFLSERRDRAFTEREIVLGVDFSPMLESESGRRGLLSGIGAAADGLLDISGTITASAIVVDDVDEALAALVEEGTVESREVETGDGTTTYYRLADGD